MVRIPFEWSGPGGPVLSSRNCEEARKLQTADCTMPTRFALRNLVEDVRMQWNDDRPPSVRVCPRHLTRSSFVNHRAPVTKRESLPERMRCPQTRIAVGTGTVTPLRFGRVPSTNGRARHRS